MLGRFYWTGSVDSSQLIEAARTEQGVCVGRGHAALYCLIGWAYAQLHTQGRAVGTDSAESALG